mgnify:CR=1 FL=1
MYETDDFTIWNLTPNVPARCGSVEIFNIVGTLRHPDQVTDFFYSLNDEPENRIYFHNSNELGHRLCARGDFNIDTITLNSLSDYNRLRFRVMRSGNRMSTEELFFSIQSFTERKPLFSLRLDGKNHPEQVGQIVEGNWKIDQDEQHQKCLEVTPENAGYDRIILFGRSDWSSGYEILARLSVTSITGSHNVGIIFKWNPHEQGDGTWLPTKWSTGLGYYRSYPPYPGLRIRYGVGVHRNEAGGIEGDFLLGTGRLSKSRYILGIIKRKIGLKRQTSELELNKHYFYRIRIHPQEYSLTVWPNEKKEPAPQIVVNKPIDPLPYGSVGIIAYQVGVRLYQFDVTPLFDEGGARAFGY